MLSEREIKVLLIDWLYEKGLVEDAVIISEMVVANWSRRADIAVANGRLYGFEIKSHFDTLKRLPGQIESFQEHFDKVVVVAASKFISSIESQYSEDIGILEVFVQSGRPRLRQVRAGRIREVKSVARLTSLITKVELERFLKVTGITYPMGAARAELAAQCGARHLQKLRAYVLSCIKNRYAESFEAFTKERNENSTESGLDLLSRSVVDRVSLERQIEKFGADYKCAVKPRAAKPLNFAALGLDAEASGVEMPQSVIVRRRR
ncbi:sce7726 family protein [Pseudomonas sp. GZD-209]|uniref:sce7726 family protein n=1 Tax=Pseudomonas sp. GZD-209 TaxID=3404807 RepID=UPI003BB7BEFA